MNDHDPDRHPEPDLHRPAPDQDGPGSRGDPFAVPLPEAPADGSCAPPRRPSAARTLRALIFAGLMLVVATTVAAVLMRRNHQPGAFSAGTQLGQGAAASGVLLREDQTRQFEQLMAAMGQERKLAEGENRRILAGIAAVQGAQGAQDRRLVRLEEISSDLVSRGLAREAATSDAAGLPAALQPLVAPGLAVCRSLLLERGLHGWAAVREPFSAWARARVPELGDDDLHRLYEITQVAREAIADAHYDAILPLVRQRIALRIARDDLPAVVHLVWSGRSALPPSSAGQLVAVANLVARADPALAISGRAGEAAAGGLAEDQDLVVARPVRLGFQPCRSTDVAGIVGLASPYLAGGLAIDEQDAVLAAYAASRAAAVAGAFLRRRSEQPQALLASLLEEGRRAVRLPRPALQLAGGDPRQRSFAAACITGLVLARAVREGVQDASRVATWASEMAAGIPAGTIMGLDLGAPQRAYAALTARDLATPLCPPQLGDAMDRSFAVAAASAAATLAPAERAHFLAAAAIQAAAAAVVCQRTSELASAEQLGAAIRAAVALSMVQAEAQAQVRHAIDDELIPLYAGLYEGSTRDWPLARAQFLAAAVAAIDATLSERLGEQPAPALASQLLLIGRSEAETAIARTAALDAITRDLDRVAAHSPLTLMRVARELSRLRVYQAISAQVPRYGQIRTASAIAREAIAIAQGRHRVRTPPAAPGGLAGQPAPAAPAAPAAAAAGAAGSSPLPGGVPPAGEGGAESAADAIQVVHAAAGARVATRTITIPAGAYAEARIFSGVVCELGNEKPEPMLINLDYSWSGPAGTVLTMKDLRLIAECTAMGGAPRVRAHITTISYDLPEGSHCSVPVDGWAVDDVAGEAGAIGVWNWNLSAVAPLGMLDGVLGGLAGLLQPTQQTTSVNTSITIQQTETTPLKNTGEGAAIGLNNSVGKHLEKTLENIKPAVEVPNNQACTVVMRSDAVLPIPLAVWNRRVDQVDLAGRSGFVR